jgi:hypothetical protein
MKRLILFLGLVWALIYTANHTVFVRAPSDTKAKVATSTQQLSTDRRIDSWGAYLPHVRPPLRTQPRIDSRDGVIWVTRSPRDITVGYCSSSNLRLANRSLGDAPAWKASTVVYA